VSSAGKLWLQSFWMRKAWGDSSEHQSLYWNTKKSFLLSLFVQQMSEVLCLSMTLEGYRHLSAQEVITLYGQCFFTHQMVLTLHFQIVKCLVILKKKIHVTALLHQCWGTAEHHAPVAEEGEQRILYIVYIWAMFWDRKKWMIIAEKMCVWRNDG